MPTPDNLAVPLHYCRNKIGGAGSALHYSLLFQAPAPRAALTALYALRREFNDVADECTDPGVARAKLAWWREEIINAFTERERHPVALLLAPAIRQHHLPRETFDELLHAAATRLPPWRCARFDELLEYARRAGGGTAVLATGILGGAPATARALGAALELAETLCDLGVHARHDRLPLPQDDLARFHVATADILRGKDSAAFRALMAFEADRAEAMLRESLRALAAADRCTLLPLRIQAHITLATLAVARRRGYAVLQRRPTLIPLRMLWIAWRTRRAC